MVKILPVKQSALKAVWEHLSILKQGGYESLEMEVWLFDETEFAIELIDDAEARHSWWLKKHSTSVGLAQTSCGGVSSQFELGEARRPEGLERPGVSTTCQ